MIDFLKYRTVYFSISAVVIMIGLFSLVRWGYVYSIDFVGGTTIDYSLSTPVSAPVVDKTLAAQNIKPMSTQIKGTALKLRLPALVDSKQVALKTELAKQSQSKVTIIKSQTVGPVLGKETIRKTIIASLCAIVGILLYMAFSFKGFDFAFAAIIAMFHDFLVVIGSYSIFSHFLGAEFDTLFVTALLTTMSFSVHDTIIIFDKIREYKKTMGTADMYFYANKALTETLIRSVNNSMTIIFMLLALTLLGGTTIRFFVASLLVGTVTGTYSSPFIATPMLVWLERSRTKK
jgi:preprotein translocase subunit SecF